MTNLGTLMRGSLLAALLLAAVAQPLSVAAADTSLPTDPYRNQQWGLDRIRAEEAWSESRGEGAVVAVIDTGVDLSHPDLVGQLAGKGMSFTDAGSAAGAQDEVGHGTHVAGIIAAATDNGIGVAGVAPAAKILPVRVCTPGCVYEDIARGIRYAVKKKVDVINLSLGAAQVIGRGADVLNPVLSDAIDQAWDAGIVLVAAAGNNNLPLCNEPAYRENVICVGATVRGDQLADYSQFEAVGDNYLVAPGGPTVSVNDCSVKIWSLWLRGSEGDGCSAPGYKASQGTSMATPFVSGVAALLAGQDHDNEVTYNAILESADDLGPPGRDPLFGHGMVDASAALRVAEEQP